MPVTEFVAMSPHPFDQALQLQAVGADSPDTWCGHTSPAYWNMVGPFGGWTAAIGMQAVMQHSARLGEPVALTVNYASAILEGPFTITATPVQTNRSTQHWVVSLNQVNASGVKATAMTATAMTALRRDTWQVNDMPMPEVPAPSTLQRAANQRAMEWLNRYDMRFVRGAAPTQWDDSASRLTPDVLAPDSLSQLWVRDDQVRPLDLLALTSLADVFYPRVWLRRPVRVAAGTVSMTVYFHASSAQLADCGTGYLLCQARAQAFRHGFFDQVAHVWSESGTLMATSTQLVYYKE